MSLRMRAGRADQRRLEADVQIAAVQTAPDDLFRLLEDGAVLHVFEQGAVAAFMLLFGDADMIPHRGDFGETLFARLRGESRIEIVPLVVFAAGSFLQVRRRVGDDSGRETRGDFEFAALEELEEALGVLLFLIRGLLEDCLLYTSRCV